MRPLESMIAAVALATLQIAPAFAGMTPLSGRPSTMVVPVVSIYDNAPRLKDIRARVVAGKPVSTTELKMLADVGDGLAAHRLAVRILEAKQPKLNAMAARYLAIAVDDGRGYAIPALVDILSDRSTEIPAASLSRIENTLKRQAATGNMEAAVALARLYTVGHPFGAKPQEAGRLLKKAANAQALDPDLALQMAVMVAAKSPLTDTDIATLRSYLALAAQSQDLGTRTAAENLLQTIRVPQTEEEDEQQ